MAESENTQSLLRRLFRRERIIEPDDKQDGSPSSGALDVVAAWYHNRMLLSPNRNKRYKDYKDMGEDPMISGALNLYADDSTQIDPFRKQRVWPQSRSVKVRDALREMFDEIEIEDLAWPNSRATAQYGDRYLRPLCNREKGIVGVEPMEPDQMERVIDKYGRLTGWKVNFMGDHQFDPWEFVHFRVIGSSHAMQEGGSIYGTSLLEAARRPYRQLRMLEDSIVIYRLEIGGQHRIFYVDVTGLGYAQGITETKKVELSFGKKEFYNPNTREFSERFQPLYLSKDIFWPVRKESASRVEFLGTDPNITGVADLEFIRYNLHAALAAPRAFLGGDEYQSAKYGLCLTGDTAVPSLDGRMYRLDEVVQKVLAGEDVWLMSCRQDGRLVPGRVKAGLCTGRREDMLEVELDNGETVKCTSNHPFMLRDGSYRAAIDLQPGDSLMPYYSRTFGKGGYYFAKDNQTERWRALHTIVDEHFNGALPDGQTVHHNAKNNGGGFNRWDNRPGSLLRLSESDHKALHRADAVRRNQSPEHRALVSRLASEGLTGFGARWREDREHMLAAVRPGLKKAQLASRTSEAHSEASRRVGKLYGRDNLVRFLTDDEYAARRADAKRRGGLTKRRDIEAPAIIDLVVGHGVRSKKEIYARLGTSQTAVDRAVARHMGCPADWRTFLRHLGVQPLPGSARRGASSRLAANEFNHKVAAVRPAAPADVYDIEMDGEPNFALGAGVFVHNSQIYIVFSRLTSRLQRSQVSGYERLGQIHLALRGIDPMKKENAFRVCMMQPSSLEQEQRLEVLELATELALKVKQAGEAIGADADKVKRQAEMIFFGLTPYDLSMIGQDDGDDGSGGGDSQLSEDLYEQISKVLEADTGLRTEVEDLRARLGLTEAGAEADYRAIGERGDAEKLFPSADDEIDNGSIRENYVKWVGDEELRMVQEGQASFGVELDAAAFEAIKPYLHSAAQQGSVVVRQNGPGNGRIRR